MKYNATYGPMKQEMYSVLLLLQAKACAICGKVGSELVMDHDHKTGKIRGLLCRPCNSWLGHHLDKEGEAFLRNALEYVIKPPARRMDTPGPRQKRCAVCGETKELDQFYVYKGRAHSYCKPCQSARSKAYQAQRRALDSSREG